MKESGGRGTADKAKATLSLSNIFKVPSGDKWPLAAALPGDRQLELHRVSPPPTTPFYVCSSLLRLMNQLWCMCVRFGSRIFGLCVFSSVQVSARCPAVAAAAAPRDGGGGAAQGWHQAAAAGRLLALAVPFSYAYTALRRNIKEA